jgi:WD40 repeat protein
VRVWNVRTGEWTHKLKKHTNRVSCVELDATTIVSGSDYRTVRIWRGYNTADFVCVIEGHTEGVTRVWLCTAPNEHIVVSADAGLGACKMHVHDIRTGDRVCAPIECYKCKLSLQSGTHHVL